MKRYLLRTTAIQPMKPAQMVELRNQLSIIHALWDRMNG